MDHTVAQTALQNRTEVEDLPPVELLHLTMRMRGGTPLNGSAAMQRAPAPQETVILARKEEQAENALFRVDVARIFRVYYRGLD